MFSAPDRFLRWKLSLSAGGTVCRNSQLWKCYYRVVDAIVTGHVRQYIHLNDDGEERVRAQNDACSLRS